MHSVNETKAPLEYDVDGFRSHSELENEWEGRLLVLHKNTEQTYRRFIIIPNLKMITICKGMKCKYTMIKF